MIEHLAVVAAAVPFQFALGMANTHRKLLSRGEMRFWCIAIFIVAELIYLGAF
jgi:hypothetical protein